MTNTIDETAVAVDVYPDEFHTLLKVINRAMLHPEEFDLTEEELEVITTFQVDFATATYEYGIN